MNNKQNIKIGISIGDINGIGLEIILKTFSDQRMMELCTPVIFAGEFYVNLVNKMLRLNVSNIRYINEVGDAVDGKINVVCALKGQLPRIEFGKQTPEAGKIAVESLKHATLALKNNEVDVLVTAPINKNNIQSQDFHFPGHTDFLANALEGQSLMFLVSQDIRVGLVTDHVPISKVSQNITKQELKNKILYMWQSLQQDFAIRQPKIAVLGLNPHCGDNGVIGREDDTVVRPAVEEMFSQGKLIFGPYSSDTFFVEGYKHFDATLAMYHDQGLIPFKTISFGQGVNFTAGLKKIRTSPDHGVAYDIAGKAIADESSFRRAVFQAIDIFRNREEFNQNKEGAIKVSYLVGKEQDEDRHRQKRQNYRAETKEKDEEKDEELVLQELKREEEEMEKQQEKESFEALSKILRSIMDN